MTHNQYLHPETSRLFTAWADPISGVASYILTEHVAPYQQAFYFTNSNISADGRFMWFYAGYPPASGQVLGLVDLLEQEVRVFPETRFVSESPWVDEASGEVYWAINQDVYKRAPDANASAVLVGRIPNGYFGRKAVRRVTTHLTRSANQRLLNLDLIAGDIWHICTLEIATGEVNTWQSFPICYKHAQFSPTDPTLMMICQDWWDDIKTGENFRYKNRIWLIRQGEEAKPIFADDSGKNMDMHSHEWWAKDGQGIWWVDFDHGTEYYHIKTGEHMNVWPNGTCHSHSSSDDQWLVGDIGTYEWAQKPSKVVFYNRKTKKELCIVSALPQPPEQTQISYYHAHPHPQFIMQDEFIAYTTTVLGGLDYALVRVSDLIKATL